MCGEKRRVIELLFIDCLVCERHDCDESAQRPRGTHLYCPPLTGEGTGEWEDPPKPTQWGTVLAHPAALTVGRG